MVVYVVVSPAADEILAGPHTYRDAKAARSQLSATTWAGRGASLKIEHRWTNPDGSITRIE